MVILSSIIPPRIPFAAPGPELLLADQPRLFERLTKLARLLGQQMPAKVFLVSDVNAWVAHVNTGDGKKRVMGIGLPLLQVLSVSQFEAVLAHEFGHYHGGDTRVGPWIYKTRLAIGQTVETLSHAGKESGFIRALRVPFVWYGKMFLGVTQAVSRAQELSADRLAATTVGSDALAAGLSAVHRVAPVAAYYMNSEALPVVRNGFSPPLTAGLASFLRKDSTASSMDELFQQELSSPRASAYDTHPPLAQRLSALEKLPKSSSMDGLAGAVVDRQPAGGRIPADAFVAALRFEASAADSVAGHGAARAAPGLANNSGEKRQCA